jgi:hypothetical protein
MNRFLRLAAWALAAILMTGCAVIQPVLPPTSQPDATAGYVAGGFTRVKSGGFAFIVRNLDTSAEFALSLGEDTSWPTDVENQVVAIKLPPGRYAVSHWITYATLTKERISKSAVSNPYLSAPFSVAAGSVTYLGHYSVSTLHSGGYVNYRISPRPVMAAGARSAFLKAYPAFSGNDFSCRLCTDTLPQMPTPTPLAK